MAWQGFGKNSGPSFPPRSPTLFGTFPSTTATTTTNPPFNNEPTPTRSTPLQKQRSNTSPTKLVDEQKSPHNQANSVAHQQFNTISSPGYVHGDGNLSPPRPADYHAPKRTRSPPIRTSNEVSPSECNFHELDAEREVRAKAKRLARFGAELSQSVQIPPDSKGHKTSDTKHNQSQMDKMKVAENNYTNFTGEFQNGIMLPDSESQETSTSIVGICQDMCPESEREERERKGDLDQYERLDGDRNQTSRYLAVKKYNRTAEREAVLIRPMPVLQKTIDYLLELMDQPYSYSFLGMYNFLWDRMRAIRMDLRMQHIFDQHAIIMLEQMIRLHIIAMHELCEYKKGEGFSEGFDAHLNIEQMNKTSVELFQMYDDHRKKGINVLTEKEFRGYYALLKLDKHPGYKVEPAELSLDLAKMTPEIRGSREVLFARDVARACRTGNFINFFRLARKATYLQACLMHAHFAKLRTHALASLHSGLQNNQGIPVAHVVKWLGMEGEDIDDLLQYHGFAIKMFEDTYMVKESPFLGSDGSYPTKCSKLVHLKKSQKIIDDVSSGPVVSGFSRKKTSSSELKDKFVHRATEIPAVSDVRNEFARGTSEVPAVSDLREKFAHRIAENPVVSSLRENLVHKTTNTPSEAWVDAVDGEMQKYENNSIMKSMELIETSTPTLSHESGKITSEVDHISISFPGRNTSVSDTQLEDDQMDDSDESMHDKTGLTSTSPKGKLMQIQTRGKSDAGSTVKSHTVQKAIGYLKESEEVMRRNRQQHEAVMEKLKIILRKWKEKASKKREIREKRLLLANLALSSIFLGPPLRQNENHPGHDRENFDIDFIMRERDEKREKSLLRLNVADVVGPVLITKNCNSRCICWKLLVCLHRSDMVHNIDNIASTWLVSKLMGSVVRYEDELVLSSTSLSIWKKLIEEVPDCTKSFCFSVVRKVLFNSNREESLCDSVVGANAIMYLISENTPCEIQRNQLHSLLLSIPSGSRLPLLILSYHVQKGETSDPQSVISRLGLLGADRTRISSISVVFLSGDSPVEQFGGFLSDENLRGGLQWLANQSPLQPTLRLVKTRDLVLKYLGSSLKFVNNMKIADLDPDRCIAIFNEALQQSANQVRSAAYMNPNCWPCPEIDLLKRSSIEKRVIETFLPKTGWSLAARIEPIVAAINGCKLPSFSDNISWLSQGSYMGKELLDQRLSLEKHLSNYLMESAKIMSGDLARKEAHLMLQRGAFLDLQVAYILDHDVPFIDEIFLNKLTTSQECNIRGDTRLKAGNDMQLNLVPLDEMIDIACCFPSNELPTLKEPPERAVVIPEFVSRPSENDNDINLDSPYKTKDDFCSVDHEKEMSPMAPLGGSDRLSSLMEQCNTLQNSIEEKLSIYF